MSKDDPHFDLESRKQQLTEELQSLPVERREERLRIEPYYPEVRDEIIEPDRVTMQTWYFWKHWAPKLGPVPTALLLRLRMHCYYNRHTGEIRDTCYPKQSTLAQEIGLKDKKAVMRALRTLEDFGFLQREAQYKYDPNKGKKVRTSDLYRITMTDPIAPDHQGDLVVKIAERIAEAERKRLHKGPDSPQSQKRTQVNRAPRSQKGTQVHDVDNRGPKSLIRTEDSGPKKGPEVVPRRSTPNVNNVGISTREGTLQTDPRVATLTPQERSNREVLALEMGDKLSIMAGQRDLPERKDAGFLRRVAFLMPEQLVNEALTATRDAIENERAGRKTIPKGAAAYFTGVVKKIAEREGIDLGLRSKS